MKQTVRVAGGQGFWGDLLTAPIDQVRKGPIDYLMLDYLAEVTMSIVQKQRARDPNAGYARDFVSLMQEILPDCVGTSRCSNAGGVNIGAGPLPSQTSLANSASRQSKDRGCRRRRHP
jgi:hypothetical protein